jgi:ankyrin repeat protein
MLAAEQGHATVVDVLIRAGADASRRDRSGKTAADLASDEAIRQKLAAR